MNVIDRFLKYVSFDTQSDPESNSCPSSAKQKLLGAELASELSRLGLQNSHMDEYGSENFKIDTSKLFSKEWKALLKTREDIIKPNDNILLKDL